MNLNHLRTFVLVAEHGSLSAAARALGVPASTVSRHVVGLEAALGTDLVHRGARHVTLTVSGSEVLARCQAPLRDLAEIASGLAVGEPAGRLRITAPTNLTLSTRFISMLVRFQQAYPNVQVDMDGSAWNLDPIDQGFDVAFRPLHTVRDASDRIVRRLSTLPLGLYASPAYVQRRGLPECVEALVHHDMVSARLLVGQPLTLVCGEQQVRVVPRVLAVGDDLSFVLSMVQAGAGYGVIPELEAQARAGAWVRVLPAWSLKPLVPAIVWPRRRFAVPRVRAFVDFAAAALGEPTP